MEDNRKEAETENSVKEIPETENRGGTYADIYAEGGALGPDGVDFREKIGSKLWKEGPAMRNVK